MLAPLLWNMFYKEVEVSDCMQTLFRGNSLASKVSYNSKCAECYLFMLYLFIDHGILLQNLWRVVSAQSVATSFKTVVGKSFHEL